MDMKRITLFLIVLALAITGCKKGVPFTLESDLASARFDSRTDTLILQSEAFPEVVFIKVKNGKFSFSDKIQKPTTATLKAVGRNPATRLIVLEEGVITFEDGIAVGTKQNDAAAELIRSLQEIARSGDRETVQETSLKTIRTFVSRHSNESCAVLAIMQAKRYADDETIAELIGMTSRNIRSNGLLHQMTTQQRRNAGRRPAQQ